MLTGTISIQEVLRKIADHDEGVLSFSIAFVRASGPRRGEIRVIARAQRGTPSIKERNLDAWHGRKKPLHKEAGTIPITDLDAPPGRQYKSPKISHIIVFNGLQVRH